METSPSSKQSSVLSVIRSPDPRRSFDEDLGAVLSARLHEELAGVADAMEPADRLYVDKYKVGAALGCEGRYYAELYEPFVWSLANVRGKLAHRAIERMIVGRYVTAPLDFVENAVEHFASEDAEDDLAKFLRSLDDEERHELIHDVGDIVTKYALDWPEIRRDWTPRVESKLYFPLFDGKIRLQGRVDLGLGKPAGHEARVFVADWKSGAEHDGHLHDVRFYALVEALVRGVPPYRVGTYYLDSGRFVCEDITEDVLEAALRRVVDAATRMRRVQSDPCSVELRPGPLCNFCPAKGTCEVGTRWLAERDEELP